MSCVWVCIEIVSAVVDDVLCDCICDSSGKEEKGSGITLVLVMLRTLLVRNRSRMCEMV